MKDDYYNVKIDSSLKSGSLTYGEYFKKGKISDEVLLSTYICHPSLCNDNMRKEHEKSRCSQKFSK